MDIILLGFIASLLAGLATSVGAMPVFFVKKLTEKFEDTSLGFAAGVMLAASFFSLIIPGLDYAESMYHSTIISLSIVLGGLIAGVIVIWVLQSKAPHEHFILGTSHSEAVKVKLSKIWLFIIAITLHNMPAQVQLLGDRSSSRGPVRPGCPSIQRAAPRARVDG